MQRGQGDEREEFMAGLPRRLGLHLMVVHFGDVDGVPVVWVHGQAPLSATLMFRVGVRDETMATCGITHMIEHLALSTLGRRRYSHDATVDLTFTEFTVSGKPEAVVAHLSDVCSGLTSLPMERLPTEAKVLKAEGGAPVHPVVAAHLRQRYGLRGLGQADVSPPALGQLKPEQIASFAAGNFTRGKAVLALTGPPPEGLTLDLPEGPRCPVPPSPRLELPFPMWFELGGAGLGLSFEIAATGPVAEEAAGAVLRITLDRAVDELRHRRGWVYGIDYEVHAAGTKQSVCFTADPPDEHAEDVRKGLTQILQDLRDSGPTEAELSEDAEAEREYASDPTSAHGEVAAAAAALLLDRPVLSAEERLEYREAVTAKDCQAALGALDTMIVGMPEGVEPDDSVLAPEPQCSATRVTGRRLYRTLSGLVQLGPRRARITLGDEGITLDASAGPFTVLWDDLVGVAVDDTWERLTLIGADSVFVPFAAHWFRGGKAALAEINSRIDPALRFVPEDEEHTRLDRWMATQKERLEQRKSKVAREE